MTKQQKTDKDGFAVLKTSARTVESAIDVHQKGGYRTGWSRVWDRSQKPAATRLTKLAKKILAGE